MKTILLLFIGGGIGASARHSLSILLNRFGIIAPWPILAVNLLGCFLIGLLAPLFTQTSSMRLFLITGILGGFTTYSSYTLDLLQYLEKQELLTALIYLFAHLLGGLLCATLGICLGKYALP